jgi:N-methylhydantoinase B/oxoprolinase/acetone carboxylase alpha subunit
VEEGGGNPLDRDPERVRKDVEGLKVLIRRARNVYGVVIKPGSLKIDHKATEELRKKLRNDRLYNRHVDDVLDDTRKGKISIQEAKDTYGVVIKNDRGRLVIHFKETQKLRAR